MQDCKITRNETWLKSAVLRMSVKVTGLKNAGLELTGKKLPDWNMLD